MAHFDYRDGQLCAEQFPLADVAARFGTPAYVYSRAAIEARWRDFDAAFGERPHQVCFAVKANGNLAVLNLLARLGSGFDIVSAGELERVLAAGGSADRIVFSGVGKRDDEIRRALEAGIRGFNIESPRELERLAMIARDTGHRAPVAVRVNPDVDARTHPYIATGLKHNKFGIAFSDAPAVYARAAELEHIDVRGIACHIGSQIVELAPYLDMVDRMLELTRDLRRRGIAISHLDLGGGLGIRYRDENPPEPAALVQALCERSADDDLELYIEPGRSIAGNAGVLLTRVLDIKKNGDKRFVIVDTAMNDLLRPALYDAWQDILPVTECAGGERETCDVVGPVCESADFLGRGRLLAARVGDLLAICSVGAYGFAMSSNYNARPRPPEIMVSGAAAHEVRRRETIADLMAGEQRLPA